jgi:hypothetical protein
MEDGTMIPRMDCDVKIDALLYVMWILCQMAEKAPSGVRDSSLARAAVAGAAAEGGNLSVLGLILVLVAR